MKSPQPLESGLAKFLGLTPTTFGCGRLGAKLLSKALAGGAALGFVVSLAWPADAASRKSSRHASETKVSKNRDDSKGPFDDLPKGPLQMVVSIGQQHVTLYSNGMRIAQVPVSTGTPGHPTPMVVFSIIEKDRWHHSNLYGNAPMYYMQRLTWSGVAMHEGVLPGVPASHGCIRMPSQFASRLWAVTRLGVRVIVTRTDTAPHEFDHPKLFNPRQKPADTPAAAAQTIDGLRPTLAANPAATTGPNGDPIIRVAWAVKVTTDARSADIPDRSTTTPAGKVMTKDQPAAAPEPPVTASADVTPAETALAPEPVPAPMGETAEAPVVAADAPQLAPAPPAHEPAPVTAEAPQANEPAKLVEAKPAAADLDKPAIDFSDPRKPLLPKPRTAEPIKRTGQVAVFVSRKEKKVFVRQAFVPVFDMPVEIANPDQPLGTHVFTAMEVQDHGARMRWNAISMPGDPPRYVERSYSRETRNRSGRKSELEPVLEARPASTAAQALDRIQFPQEAIDRISEILIPGSSLLISDQGLGPETGRQTEFIVLAR